MNPYTSSGSVATMTANVSGNDSLNDLGDGPRQPGDPERYPVGAVTRRLLGYVRPHRVSFAASFLSAAVSVILQLYTPILIGEGIDLIVAAGQVDFDALLPLVTKLAIVVVGAAAFQWLQGYCVNRLSYETVRDMRVEASDKLSRMPLSFIDSHAHGDLMSRVVNDVDQVGDGLLQGFTQLFTGVITIVGTLAFMLSINLTMTLVVVLVTPLSIFAAGAIAKLSNKSFTAQQRIQGQLGGHIEEYVGEQKLVDAFAYGPNAQLRFDALNAELCTAGERAQFMGSLSNPGTRFINNIIYAVVAVIGCVGVITGVPAALTVGGVQIFLSYANQYTKPFNEVTNVITQIQTAYASARRMFALLDAREQEPDAEDAVELAVPQGEVTFEHVDFSYVPDRKLLQDICIEAKPGMRFALVGPTGCGKTTLMKMIAGFVEPDSGEIEIGQTIKIGYYGQEISIDPDIRVIDYIKEAAEYVRTNDGLVSASAMLERFLFPPEQQYSPVGKLSGGEKRRLHLLRVLMTAPNVLIMDEPTNDLDTQTLAILEDYLDNYEGIVITVSHDRYFLDRIARRIFAFEGNGRIVQYEGGYSDYMAKRPEPVKMGMSGSTNEKNDIDESNGEEKEQTSSKQTWKHEKKVKFSYNEKREYETIETDIEKLENQIAELDEKIMKNASDFGKLNALTKEKDEVEAALLEKMDRREYLEEIAQQIE